MPAKPAGRIMFVLGGAASGKSQTALDLARGLAPPQAVPVPVGRSVQSGQTPRADGGKGVSPRDARKSISPRLAFVATGQALDEEMAHRIARHQSTRSSDWTTVEEPIDPAAWFSRHAQTYQAIVLDCVTLWLSNLQGQGFPEAAVPGKVEELLKAMRGSGARVVIVSNELGLGLVPLEPAGRAFRDLAGRANQQIAAEADEVYFVVSGLAQRIK
ncbi:Bifunctional adenosylcobalamin biosynthesis protein CobU [Nitrospira moscoviensis]|uniref:Adenosylcobinamide kinase n=2 Tax=Nitrospira moscoviensis TaxID=42253 RepID=A0A0K2GBB1_NITMO|nr:Bifunctional adenosylcobalamin biosynthesis protein CobU [Nitrospira moscoviensis]